MKLLKPWQKDIIYNDCITFNLLDVDDRRIAFIDFYLETYIVDLNFEPKDHLELHNALPFLKELGYEQSNYTMCKHVNSDSKYMDINIIMALQKKVINILTTHFDYKGLDDKQLLLM